MWTARLLVFASLFAPAALGEFGSLDDVCYVCVCVCMWSRCRRKTHPLHFVCWKLYQNFSFLLFKG